MTGVISDLEFLTKLQRILNEGVQDKVLTDVFNAARFPFDADASSSVARWAYENADKANAMLWVWRTGETSHSTEGWKGFFG